MLTNTIGQRNRNTLAINSKHRPSVTTNSKNLAANKSTGAGRKARPVEKSNSTKQAKPTARKVAKVFNDHDLYIHKRSSGPDESRGIAGVRLDWTRRGTHGLEAGDGRPQGRPLRQRVMLTVPQARWSTVGSPRKRLCQDAARRGPPVRAWTRRPKGGHS